MAARSTTQLDIDTLKAITGITDAQLDSIIGEDKLSELAGLLGKYEPYVGRLGFNLNKPAIAYLSSCDKDYGYEYAMTRALKAWFDVARVRITYRLLVNILIKLHKKVEAEAVCKTGELLKASYIHILMSFIALYCTAIEVSVWLSEESSDWIVIDKAAATVPRETGETTPSETVPSETVPSEPVPSETVTSETVPSEMVTSGTGETIPSQTQKINQDLIIFKDELLGSGGFGAVFKGSYKGGPCAVKLLLHDVVKMREDLEIGKNEAAHEAFERECRFLNQRIPPTRPVSKTATL